MIGFSIKRTSKVDKRRDEYNVGYNDRHAHNEDESGQYQRS